MGEEIEFIHADSLQCDRCGNEITFRISGFEYPIGAFDYKYNEIDGGRFDKAPHMGVIYSHDEFDLDDTSLEFTRVEEMIMDIAQNPDLIYNISA